ncbi:BCN_G0049820.mRNA.1.CDS.1 [Saccharomyces cerevisiae]|nr:BCN_G0049820.mRNA.1.CDS.1 [Saccharomyces cerevisiae]CAI4790683.1 BCE_3a_G0049930.mRNA.1.CDS.1 [Saccharomyces cerevisiae]CAI7336389.1 BCN_G0049820.mRNA.1.CDS.1 [Saccharomyces cerevisiae]CAI7340995.1 BCE_3a_G0049930.mRNA.1.CDS.1 [Saccharomyces cerevisiae]
MLALALVQNQPLTITAKLLNELMKRIMLIKTITMKEIPSTPVTATEIEVILIVAIKIMI